MSVPPNQRQVSLRGSSAKEITRDALIEKVSQERDLRNYLRRAATSALFIQRVWRRYYKLKRISSQIQEEWEGLIHNYDNNINLITKNWVSDEILRPFLFFIAQSPWEKQKLDLKLVNCTSTCFSILLSSINSSDPDKNFCSFTVGSQQEKSTWIYQAKKLVSLCSAILAECNFSNLRGENEKEKMVQITVLAMRLSVSLTDSKTWKCLNNENIKETDLCLKKLIGFMATRKSGLYNSIRKYLIINFNSTRIVEKQIALSEDKLLITASVITLALRPFNLKNMEMGLNDFDIKGAYIEYIVFILTIPYFFKYLPPLLLPAVRHGSILVPCLSTLLTAEGKIFEEISKLHSLEEKEEAFNAEKFPYSGWILANIINLSTNYDQNRLIEGLDCNLYIDAINCVSRNFLNLLETGKEMIGNFNKQVDLDGQNNDDLNVKLSFIEVLSPVHQQWHLTKLLSLSNDKNTLGLTNIIYLYYHMLRIFSLLNPLVGSMTILNTLSFNPDFIVKLWVYLEKSIFGTNNPSLAEIKPSINATPQSKQNKGSKDTKWANVFQKIKGKSSETEETGTSSGTVNADVANNNNEKDEYEIWDVEMLRKEHKHLSKELLCTLHLFCASYGHLLLVLDDIEFYEKQAPFSLAQQRRIASSLNTFVYRSLSHPTNSSKNEPLLDAALRCVQLQFERDLRHPFCPPALWLAPARRARPADSARSGSALTSVPHVYPFEERVKIFRELIKQDKLPHNSARPIEILVQRDRLISDGMKQLNPLGPGLKSSIHVSFVSACGLAEAGLDYGGLTKEFLTELAKEGFNPEYGLFSQISTSSTCSLIPTLSARTLPTGLETIEFLGRVAGKALYEGILLEVSFSLVFVQKLLGRYGFLDELASLDDELYRNLMRLKHFEGDVSDLCLDFTVTEELNGRMIVHELRPGGKNVQVVNENKLQYVHAMADFKLNRQIVPFANAFYRGLSDLISPSWLSLFNANEFNQLLSGGKQDFDVDDLKNNTKYTGGYSESSRTVKLFWEVLKVLSTNERCMLLKFVTSCSRAPLLGFKYLQPSFTIHKVTCDVPLWASIGGQDVNRLPSASTCYNTLKLPTYKRASTLKSKLLYAISSNTGFELS